MEIIRATLEHAGDVAKLFDGYRQFYDCAPDPALASEFISSRIENDESVIFVLRKESSSRGFVQLYPSFCSVDAIPILILYDLFVAKDCRGKGYGEALMNRAREYAQQVGVTRLDLLTAKTNRVGQRLYEKLGYRKVLEDFHAYSLDLSNK